MGKTGKFLVVFATDGIFPHAIGGIQRHSLLLLEMLQRYDDLELHVIHPHSGEKIFDSPNVKEHVIRPIDSQRNYILECYRYSSRVESVIRTINPHVIYAQGLTVWKNISRYKNILINNPHGLESFQAIGFKDRLVGMLFKTIQRRIFRNSRVIASEGGHLTTILEKNGFGEKVVFLPNAVTLPRVFKTDYPGKNEPVTVFFMARFVHNKGIHILFSCIEKINKTFGEHRFNFILGGKGPLYELYKNQNRFSNVTLAGFLSEDELKEKYISSDVFLLPTLFEGMPTVVLEAMSYALPVIVTDVGGTPELISPENGYLIERNSVDSVYNALLEYAALDSEGKKNKGVAGRNKVDKGFTWTKLAAMHHQLFLELIEGNSQ